MIRVGYRLIGSQKWMGGHTYLKNLTSIIRLKLKKKIRQVLIYNEDENLNGVDLKQFDEFIKMKKKNLFTTIISYFYDFEFKNVVNSKIDIFFDANKSPLFMFNKKIIPWVPDFQHKHLPNFFSFFGYWKRELIFWKRIFFHNDIIVSSNHAKRDCIKLYKKKSSQIHVVRFSIYVDPIKHLNKSLYLKKKYKIKEKYIYVPNQFWAHKNHNLILDALDYIRKEEYKVYKKIPQIIFTGPSSDVRNKGYGKRIFKRLKLPHFKEKVKYLGIIPIDDVYKLNANCFFLINPSLFEGWSTTVEEAKSFGTPTVLSKIPVHKEQSPKSLFFDPYNYKQLAKILINISKKNFLVKRTNIKKFINENHKKNQAHALSFLKAINKIVKH